MHGFSCNDAINSIIQKIGSGYFFLARRMKRNVCLAKRRKPSPSILVVVDPHNHSNPRSCFSLLVPFFFFKKKKDAKWSIVKPFMGWTTYGTWFEVLSSEGRLFFRWVPRYTGIFVQCRYRRQCIRPTTCCILLWRQNKM